MPDLKDPKDCDIRCDCGEVFSFSAGEQRFYEMKGLKPPKRCPECRLKKRQELRESYAQPENQ